MSAAYRFIRPPQDQRITESRGLVSTEAGPAVLANIEPVTTSQHVFQFVKRVRHVEMLRPEEQARSIAFGNRLIMTSISRNGE